MFLAERPGSRCACARSMEVVQIKEGCRRHQPTKTVVLVGSNHPGGGSIAPRAFQALMVGARPTTWSTSIRGLSPRAALPSGAGWPDHWNNKQMGGEILPDYYKMLSNPDKDFSLVILWCFSITVTIRTWFSLPRYPPADEALIHSCMESSVLGFILGCARHSIPSVQQNTSRRGHIHAKVIPSGIQLFPATVYHLHIQGHYRG